VYALGCAASTTYLAEAEIELAGSYDGRQYTLAWCTDMANVGEIPQSIVYKCSGSVAVCADAALDLGNPKVVTRIHPESVRTSLCLVY